MAPRRLEHLAGHVVELPGRHPGPQRRPGGLVHLGHHPPGPAHLGQLVGVAPHQGPPAMPSADPRRRSSTARDAVAGHLVGGAGAVDLGQLTPALVPLDQRRRLALVELEPAPDGLLGVVLALDHLAAADVAGPGDHGRRRRRVVGPAVHADPPRGQPLQDEVGGDLEVDHQVEPVGLEDLGQALGLGDRPRAAVEHEPPGPGVGLGDAAADHLHDQVVGEELALVHQLAGPAPRGACRTSPRPAACRPSRRGGRRSGATGARTASPCRPPACRGPRV